MAEKITYIPYGQDEISQQDLMTSLANGVPGYLDSKRWAKKDKYRQAWLNAYQDIIKGGLVGASNSSGIWTIQHGGDPIDLNNKSSIDREMYQDAAYYIQQQMSRMTPRKKEEEAKKEDLEKYGDFKTNLMNQILKGYGNNSELFADSEQGWDAQDARGTDGLRGTKNRKAAMIKALGAYKDSLNDKDFDFEGTSFKDKADLQTKIQAAIDALGTEKETDDLPAFNALGLPYRAFFSNGGNDPYTKGDYTGTYSGYNEYLAEQNKAKQKVEQEKLKQQRANQWKSFRSWDFSKLAGRPLSAEESNTTYLDNLFAKGKWTGDEQSQIVSAFKLAEQNGQLVGLSKEELAKLPSTWKNRGKYLKRINGLNTPFYYDSLSRQFKLFNNNDLNTKVTFQDILDKNNPENKQAQAKSQLVKQMNQPLQGSLNLSDLSNFGFDEATGNELWAVINDIGAFADPEAISGTALALNAARLRDKNRDGWSWERALDWGTSALGGLPVIGDAASVIKAGSNLVKLANRSARVGSFIGMAFSAVNMPEAWDSIKKIYNKGITSMTPQDIQNITYGLMGLFAGIKTINAVNARQKPQTVTEHSIEIDGKKIKLPDQATADKVSTEYKTAKNNTEASQKVVKMQEVRNAAQKVGIEVTDASKVTSGSGFLRGNQVSRKLGIGKSPVKSEQVGTGEMTGGSIGGYYMPRWRKSFLNQEQKEVKNPLRKTFDWFLGRTPEVKSAETPKTTTSETPKTTSKKTWAEIEKEPKKWSQSTEAKEYKEMLKGNYSSNAIQGGTHKIGDLTINVDIPRPGATNGFAEVTFSNGTKQTIRFDNQKQLQEQVAKIVKERRVQVDSSGKKTKVDAKEMGKILKSLKARGFLKQGGTINTPLDNIIEDFFKNNNI